MTTTDQSTTTVTKPEETTGSVREVDWRGIGLGVCGVAGFLAIWTAVASSYPSYLVPAPDAVAETFRAELTSGRMVTALRQSLQHYVPGVAVGVLCGTSLGITTAWWQRLDDLLRPVVRIVRPIPPLAWVSFAIIWVGIGHLGAAFIVAVGTFWISYFNAYAGVEDVPEKQLETAVVLNVTGWKLLLRVVLPSSLPMILAGVRTSIGRGWMTVVAAELFGAPGIGYVIITSAQNLALEVTVCYMLLISAVYLVSDWGFRLLEGQLFAWRR